MSGEREFGSKQDARLDRASDDVVAALRFAIPPGREDAVRTHIRGLLREEADRGMDRRSLVTYALSRLPPMRARYAA